MGLKRSSSFLICRFAVILLAIAYGGCQSSIGEETKPATFQFTPEPPQNEPFRFEVQYLIKNELVQPKELHEIESQIIKLEQALGVPRALLWCILFQESRFDSFKNALSPLTAKGLGQFTPGALEEVNYDTDLYDDRSGEVIISELSPKKLPINFDLKLPKKKRKHTSEKNIKFPEQKITSYYRTKTAILASAVYLNNRYAQLRKTLNRQGISYDPLVLWLYAAAAYNKGFRSILLLLTHEYMKTGEKGLTQLLHDAKASYNLLTHSKRLDSSFARVWKKETRDKYVEELVRNMQVITSCSLMGKVQ
jgi:hypothetical protein